MNLDNAIIIPHISIFKPIYVGTVDAKVVDTCGIIAKGEKMKLAEILNLIAIIIIPIIAVLIGQWLQTRSEKRKDKMHIFKT